MTYYTRIAYEHRRFLRIETPVEILELVAVEYFKVRSQINTGDLPIKL